MPTRTTDQTKPVAVERPYLLPIPGTGATCVTPVQVVANLGAGWVTVEDRNGGKYRTRRDRLLAND